MSSQATREGDRRPRLLFLLPNLHSGGGQRIVINLFRALDRRRFDPQLLVQERLGSFLPELEGAPDVRYLLDREYRRSDLPYLVKQTTKAAANTDVVFGSLEGRASICGLISAKLARKPFAAWIHIDWKPFVAHVSWRQTLGLRAYRFADQLIGCSQGAADSFRELFNVPAARVRAILNGIPLAQVLANAEQPLPPEAAPLFDGPTVVIVARLDAQKAHKDLIDAHARLIKEGVNHRLVIIGEGGLWDELTQQVRALGVADSVHFLGFQANPHRFIKRATVFALCSEFEGFGLVLAEALACGTPVVSTDCPSGPAEVLGGGKYGLLVPPKNPAALADALRRLLGDPALRRQLSELGPPRAKIFDYSTKVAEWEAMFEGLARGTHPPMTVGVDVTACR